MTLLSRSPSEEGASGRTRGQPLLEILAPAGHVWPLTAAMAIGLVAAASVRIGWGWQLWQAVALFLVVMAIPVAAKWRSDALRFGRAAAIAGALLTVQGLHTVEHGAQMYQRYVLGFSLRASNGLLSPANSEWVHFGWNWLVLAVVVYLMTRGMRGFWGWALFVWALAHTLEHTYLFVRFLQVGSGLDGLGVGQVTAQGLAGIVGEGGWLDLNAGPRLRFFCGLPGVTTANRVDAHFVWNTGEMFFLIPSVHLFLRKAMHGRSVGSETDTAPRATTAL